MYSEQLVDLARKLDRIKTCNAQPTWTTTFKTEAAFEGGAAQFSTVTYRFSRNESALTPSERTYPVLDGIFHHMLIDESRPYGVVEERDGNLITPAWVKRAFHEHAKSEFCLTADQVCALSAKGKKVVSFNAGRDHRHGFIYPGEMADEFIEVWWIRAHYCANGRNAGGWGFLSKTPDLGWTVAPYIP